MENTPLEYSKAVDKTASQIKSIQALGFEINYRHLPHSEIEIHFIKKLSLNNQGIEIAITRVLPANEVLNVITFSRHLESIYNYLCEKVKELL